MSRRKTEDEIVEQSEKFVRSDVGYISQNVSLAPERETPLPNLALSTPEELAENERQLDKLALGPDLSTIKVVRDLQREWRDWEDEWAAKLMVHYADQNERRSPFTITLLIPGEPMVVGFDTPEEAQEDTVFDDIKYEAERIWKAWQESETYVAAAAVDLTKAQEDAEAAAAVSAAQQAMDEKATLKTMARREMFIPPGMERELTVNSMRWTVTPGQVCEVPEAFVILIEEWTKAQEEHAKLHGRYTHIGTSGDVGYINQNVGLPAASSFKPPV